MYFYAQNYFMIPIFVKRKQKTRLMNSAPCFSLYTNNEKLQNHVNSSTVFAFHKCDFGIFDSTNSTCWLATSDAHGQSSILAIRFVTLSSPSIDSWMNFRKISRRRMALCSEVFNHFEEKRPPTHRLSRHVVVNHSSVDDGNVQHVCPYSQ